MKQQSRALVRERDTASRRKVVAVCDSEWDEMRDPGGAALVCP